MAYKFTIVKKGYDPKAVDELVERLEKELNEAKSKETAISRSLIKAEEVAGEILTAAEDEAKRLRDEVHDEINEELNAIEKMLSSERKALDDFCHEYDEIVKNYFTGSAVDITAPLREKIAALEGIVKERRQNIAEPAENSGDAISAP